MNTNWNVPPGDDDRAFDLLVDGELDEAARRELLLKLENTPGGWRRCALAFLEAQSWGSEFGAFARERPAAPVVAAAPEPMPQTVAPAAKAESFWHSTWGNALAVAASFALAFGLGSWYQGDSNVNTANVAPGVGASNSTQKPVEVDINDPALREILDPQGYLTLQLAGVAEGQPQQVRVPVARPTESYDTAELEQPLIVPEEVVTELRRTGHTLQQQRRYMPITLKDGRQMIVPMDELQLVPVSRTFQ